MSRCSFVAWIERSEIQVGSLRIFGLSRMSLRSIRATVCDFFHAEPSRFRRNACAMHAFDSEWGITRRREQKGGFMRMLAMTAAALGVAGTIAAGTPAPAQAQ